MPGSADTAGTHAVGAVCGYAVRTHAVSTIGGYTVRTHAVSTIGGYTVRTHVISTIGGYTIGTNTVGTISGYTVRTHAISTIFNDTEALLSTLGTAFSDAVGADTISAIFGDYRGNGLFGGNLRQGESAGGKSGDDEAGEDLLFHGRSP
jgi:hypothetical protein